MLLIEALETGGCQVEFVERPMSQDPPEHLLLQIRGAVAAYERNLIADRMRRGRQQKYRAGPWLPWGPPPSGDRTDPLHPRDPAGVRLEPAEAATVAEMFAYYGQPGHSALVGCPNRCGSWACAGHVAVSLGVMGPSPIL